MGQALDNLAKQRRRDLEIEHRSVSALDHISDAVVCIRVIKGTRHHRKTFREALKDTFIDDLTGVFDRAARVIA